MLAFFNKVGGIGVSPEQPIFLQEKIKISNQIALTLMLGIGVPFLLISKIFYDGYLLFLIIPMSGMVVMLLAFFLNYIGLNTSSRIVISICSVMLVNLYHAGVVEAGEQPIASSFMIQLSFSMIPFIIFDLREWGWFILLGVFNILTFLTFESVNQWMVTTADDAPFRYGVLSVVDTILACLLAYLIILVMVLINYHAQKENTSLIADMETSKGELENSEQQLKENLEKLQAAQEEEQKRNWTNEGLAKFGEILRNNDENIDLLSFHVVSNLVKYMEFNQGWLFLLEGGDNERYLELKACFAFDRKKFLEKRVDAEKGLLGQAILEKSTVLLKKVPEDYVNITSGLGGARPNTVLIVPLKLNEEVFGAIELATFGEIPEYMVNFVEKLSESIAATIASAKTNEKTKSLLEESQMLAEQMKAQEEEMRQNMEELQATQEEMERKNKEVEKQIQKEKESMNETLSQKEKEVKLLVQKQMKKENQLISRIEELEKQLKLN